MSDADPPYRVEDDIALLHALASRNRVEQMRPVIRRALEEAPGNPDVLYYSAVIDWQDDDLEGAKQTLEDLLLREPHSHAGRKLLADVLEDKKDFGAAEQLYLQLIQDFPRDAGLYAAYAMLMLKTMHVDKAVELAAHAVSLDPDDLKALQVSVLCKMVTSPGPEAEAEMAELLRKYPDSVHSSLTLANFLSENGRYREALPILQQVLREMPQSNDIVDAVVSLKAASHWSMVPLRPLQKWGWHASIAIWIAVVAGLRLIEGTPLAPYAVPIATVFIAFVVYSWIWPPLLRRLMRR